MASISSPKKNSALSIKITNRVVAIACALGLFIDGYLLFVSEFADPFINHVFHPSDFMHGLFQGAAPLGAVFGAMFFGRMCDIIGRKKMLLINLFLFIALGFLTSIAWNITSLCMFRFLVGIAIGMDYPICASYLVEMTPQDKSAKYAAIAMFVNCLSGFFGALVAILVIAVHPKLDAWRLMMASSLLPSVLLLGLRLHIPESIKWLQQDNPKNMDGATADRVVEREIKKTYYKKILSKRFIRTTLLLSGAWFCFDVSAFSIALFSPFIIMHLHLFTGGDFITTVMQSLKSALCIQLIFSLGAFAGIWAIGYFKSIALQKVGFLFCFVGLLILCLSHIVSIPFVNYMFIYIGFFVFNFFAGFGPDITTYLLPAELYPIEVRATGHGFCTGIAKLGAFLGLMLLPFLVNAYGVYVVVFILSLFCLAGYSFTSLLVATYGIKDKLPNIVIKDSF